MNRVVKYFILNILAIITLDCVGQDDYSLVTFIRNGREKNIEGEFKIEFIYSEKNHVITPLKFLNGYAFPGILDTLLLKKNIKTVSVCFMHKKYNLTFDSLYISNFKDCHLIFYYSNKKKLYSEDVRNEEKRINYISGIIFKSKRTGHLMGESKIMYKP